MKEFKHCFGVEILGSRINKVWRNHCHKRAEKKVCCKKCKQNVVCNSKCYRRNGDCPYYLKRSEIAKVRLARVIDPRNGHWNKGRLHK